MVDSAEKGEEKRLVMRMRKAEIKEETSDEDSKMEALAELAAANNQLAGFYEGEKDLVRARNHYGDAIHDYRAAIRLASKYGSSSSEHIYKELKTDSFNSWKRVGGRENDGLVERVNATGSLAASALGLAGGLALLTPALTGNSIGNLSTQTTAFLGTGLLIVGLIAGFFWFKNRK